MRLPANMPTDAALQDKFWPMHDMLFENQDALDVGQGLALAGPLAFAFLRRNAAQAGRGPGANLSGAFLERLGRRAHQIRFGTGSPDLRGCLCPARCNAGRLRCVPKFRSGRQGLRSVWTNQAKHADAGVVGEKAGGQFLIDQGRMVDRNVEGVMVPGPSHWLIDEAPDQVIPKFVSFLTR
jgi:hypothetical protein